MSQVHQALSSTFQLQICTVAGSLIFQNLGYLSTVLMKSPYFIGFGRLWLIDKVKSSGVILSKIPYGSFGWKRITEPFMEGLEQQRPFWMVFSRWSRWIHCMCASCIVPNLKLIQWLIPNIYIFCENTFHWEKNERIQRHTETTSPT